MKSTNHSDCQITEKLHKEIASYNIQIYDTPTVANLYYLKANALVKLAEYRNESTQMYYNQAEENYGIAINFEPENPVYLLARSKLYLKTGKITKYIIDEIKAGKIIENNSNNDVEIKINQRVASYESDNNKLTKEPLPASAINKDVQSIGKIFFPIVDEG